MADVRLESIVKYFGRLCALREISLQVHDGEFLILLGPTGAGKTTTLRIVSGLEVPDRGEVYINKQPMKGVQPRDRNCAFVFQTYVLYPHMSVYDNIAFPLRSKVWNMNENDIAQRIDRITSTLKITHLLKRKPATLSGGEQQRVALGRAMVREPQLFLMDEPLSNLDAKLREGMRVELKSIQKKLGTTFFFVTHDHVEAMTLGDRIAVLNQGSIIQVGAPEEIYSYPSSLFVAKFVGNPEINLIKCEVDNNSLQLKNIGISFPVTLFPQLKNKKLPQQILLGLRPEEIILTPRGSLKGEIYLVEDLGVDKIIRVKMNGMVLRIRIASEEHFRVGETVMLDVDTAKAKFFDPITEKSLER
jgi:multiple sugar transport system ATP-binding protein